jgi:hypothetical protein
MDRLLETLDGLPKPLTQLRQFSGPENDQHDDQDQE